MDREPILRAVPPDQARPLALRRPGNRRLPYETVLDAHPPSPDGQRRRFPGRPVAGLLLQAAPATPTTTGHDHNCTPALPTPTPTGTRSSLVPGNWPVRL